MNTTTQLQLSMKEVCFCFFKWQWLMNFEALTIFFKTFDLLWRVALASIFIHKNYKKNKKKDILFYAVTTWKVSYTLLKMQLFNYYLKLCSLCLHGKQRLRRRLSLSGGTSQKTFCQSTWHNVALIHSRLNWCGGTLWWMIYENAI